MLKGSLEEFELSDIFRLLSFTKKTGRLDVERAAGSGTVYFRGGEVYFAESTLAREPLGQKLIRSGLLTERELMAALDEHAQSGKRVGEVLVEREAITQEQLESAIRSQVQDATFELLRWDKGEFEFESAEDVVAEVPISVSVDNLIMEASRRLDELETISRKIPSGETVLRVAPSPPEGAHEISITPEEWRLLVLVDGSRCVSDVAAVAKLDEFTAMRVLYGLVAAGLVEVHSEQAQVTEVEDALEGVPEPSPEEVHDEADRTPGREDHEVEAEALEAAAEAWDGAAEDVAGAPEAAEEEPDAAPEAAEEEPDAAPETPEEEPVVAEETEEAAPEPEPEEPRELPRRIEIHAPSAVVLQRNLAFEPDAGMSREAPGGAEAPAAPEEIRLSEPMPAANEERAGEDVDDASVYLHSFLDDPVSPPGAPPAPPAADAARGPDPSVPTVDRAAVVRELAGLFNDDEVGRGEAPDRPQRLEDDDQLNRGLIHRLIDGVKGL